MYHLKKSSKHDTEFLSNLDKSGNNKQVHQFQYVPVKWILLFCFIFIIQRKMNLNFSERFTVEKQLILVDVRINFWF